MTTDPPRGDPTGSAPIAPSTVQATELVRRGTRSSRVVAGALILVVAVAAWSIGTRGALDRPAPTEPVVDEPAEESDRRGELPVSAPPSLGAAELFTASPDATTLRHLIESVGGLDSLVVGEVEGAFDLVRFDPLDADRLLASARSSYGPAENQATNEIWLVGEDGVSRDLWAPDTPHDFAHFNVDGTVTMWVKETGGPSFAPRTAHVLDAEGRRLASTEPLYASRFTATSAFVFALTGDGDYYAPDDRYHELIADGPARRVLDSAAGYGWIDNPVPDLLVGYPADEASTTAVWDVPTLRRLDGHPLADRAYQRLAISGDRLTAVAINFDGRLEQIDLTSGRLISIFGIADPSGVDQPIALNHDGTIALTVERSGALTLWWVGDDSPVATLAADSAQPRWVSERYGARSASAVAADASRVALRLPARARRPVRWLIIDTSTDRWLARACSLAGIAPTTDDHAAEAGSEAAAACR